MGAGTKEQRELLKTVQEAYKLHGQAMVPGASTAAIYEKVVSHFAAKGWRKYFVHHLSHGLGLGGDLPRVVRGDDDRLQAGEALSCELGVYIPGIGGARVENMIYGSEQGPEYLTNCLLDPELGN